ncbi:MAG: thiamine phosphate synthase [Candidatus Binataceae bacterium]|nr:thiamine phosphate synthase [Candidatus Binataceae bacterium]
MTSFHPLRSRFYAIVDSSAARNPVDLARILLDSGVRMLQLRLKAVPTRDFLESARAIAQMCRDSNALFIVNDRVDIAILAAADGVHLGQDDLPLEAARGLLGPGRIVGLSTHSVEQATAAQAAGADYIGFGPMYPGGAKRTLVGQGVEALRKVRAAVRIPIVAIGGITEARMAETIQAGADSAAIISDVLNAPDIQAKVRRILAIGSDA